MLKKYTHNQIHKKLCELLISREYSANVFDENRVGYQALFCPYYVELSGILGSDWGVIVNPNSNKFGKLVFEHDWCGCFDHKFGIGSQSGEDWIKGNP